MWSRLTIFLIDRVTLIFHSIRNGGIGLFYSLNALRKLPNGNNNNEKKKIIITKDIKGASFSLCLLVKTKQKETE